MEFIMTTDLTTEMPKKIDFNFDELKSELSERLDHYNHLVVTEDTIREAKADRATLNKLKTALESKRKEVKYHCLLPYTEFESKVKELIALVDKPVQSIDCQLKAYDEKRKQEKAVQIESEYEEFVPEELQTIIPLQRIFDDRWLNKTTSMNQVQEDMQHWVQRVSADLIAMETVEPEYQDAVHAEYMATLNIGSAMAHRERLQRAAEARKQREALQTTQPQKTQQRAHVEQEQHVFCDQNPKQNAEKLYALRLELHLTMAQAQELKRFLADHQIEYTKM